MQVGPASGARVPDLIDDVYATIVHESDELSASGVVSRLGLPRRQVEDAIYELWQSGKIQINPDSTLRPTEPGERVFRHDV